MKDNVFISSFCCECVNAENGHTLSTIHKKQTTTQTSKRESVAQFEAAYVVDCS